MLQRQSLGLGAGRRQRCLAWDGADVIALVQQPGESQLARGAALDLRQLAYFGRHLDVLCQQRLLSRELSWPANSKGAVAEQGRLSARTHRPGRAFSALFLL